MQVRKEKIAGRKEGKRREEMREDPPGDGMSWRKRMTGKGRKREKRNGISNPDYKFQVLSNDYL